MALRFAATRAASRCLRARTLATAASRHAAAGLAPRPAGSAMVTGSRAALEPPLPPPYAPSPFIAGAVDPAALYGVDGLPFLANSYDSAKKLWSVQRPYIEKLLDAQGLMLMYAVPWPPQGLFVPKEVNAVADMNGLNWRAYDKQTARMGELFKARPVTIQAAEVAQALATGRINSLVSSAQSGVDYKAWESVKFFYDVQAWLPKNMIIANKAAFNGLDKALQGQLLAEARKAEEAGWASSVRTAESTKQTLASNGMKVAAPGAKLAGELSAIGRQMVDEWLATAGADGKSLVDAFRR
jgi:TRAP-type C4-dicarboxylate transport system substrate-binding protein